MFNIKQVCWGMIGLMTISSLQPAVSANIPEIQTVVSTTQKLAADPNFASILSGNSIPTSVKLKDLTPEWRAMSTNGQLEIGNFQAFVSLFGGGALATNYYTKGQTVSIGSETYIVAYSLLSLVDKVSPEIPLNLSLLNLKTIGSMSNIRAFEPIAETKVLEGQLKALQAADIFSPKSTNEDKPTESKPVDEPKSIEPDVEVQPAKLKRKSTLRRKKVRSIRKYQRRYYRRAIKRSS
jgi:hypothetical protein